MDLFTTEIYLDVETLRLAHEVEGGWQNIPAFGLAVAVTWDKDGGFRHWFEPNARQLVDELEGFSRVITFNGNRFDFAVLSRYVPVDGLMRRSFDVHESLHKQLGHRVKLEQLARDTLGSAKIGTGLEAVEWWRKGEIQKVVEYCKHDVALLRDIVSYGRTKGHVILSSRQIRVNWG